MKRIVCITLVTMSISAFGLYASAPTDAQLSAVSAASTLPAEEQERLEEQRKLQELQAKSSLNPQEQNEMRELMNKMMQNIIQQPLAR